MSEQRRPSDRELEDALRDLGSRIEYPPTPDLSRAVRQRLEEGEARDRRGWMTSQAFRRVVAVAALVLISLVPILSGDMRGSIAGLFGGGQGAGSAASGGAAREPSPEDREDPSGSAASGTGSSFDLPSSAGGGVALGRSLELGERVSLREAQPVLLPSRLGKPDGIYAGGNAITLLYRARSALPPLGDTEAGLILTETRDGMESNYLDAEDASPERFERVSVNGRQGYWAGSGRDILPPVGEVARLPGGVLIWEQDGRALRLQAKLSKQEAVRLAESVH